MDWDFDGVEFDEEAKLRDETRKILELPELALSATCVRVPVHRPCGGDLVETEEALRPEEAEALLRAAPGLRVEPFPTPGAAAGRDEVLVGRIRRDPTVEHGLRSSWPGTTCARARR